MMDLIRNSKHCWNIYHCECVWICVWDAEMTSFCAVNGNQSSCILICFVGPAVKSKGMCVMVQWKSYFKPCHCHVIMDKDFFF